MSKLIFMSAEHVERMNEILAADAASKAACAALDRPWHLSYELSHAPSTVWWTMRFDPAAGVTFSLAPPDRPADVLFRGSYAETLAGMRRIKAREQQELPLAMEGDPAAMGVIGPAFAAAQQCATLDTEIPIA